ncbi:MAG: phage holin family protein [Acholeplasmataceae bacterium]|nr:phage holin family protein [Acholeplasmataceae bacterium]
MSNKDDKHQDDEQRKKAEEEMLALLEKLSKEKKPHKVSFAFGFLLHPNYMIHLLLSFIINLLLGAVIIGFADFMKQPIIQFEIIGFIIAMGMLTLVENFIKILMFKYMTRAMLLSMGLISVFVQTLILYGVGQITIGFHFNGVEQIIIFAILLSFLRLILSSYLRKWLMNNRLKKRGKTL